MQRDRPVERCHTVTGRGETGIDRAGPRRGVRKILRDEPRAVDRARLSLVWGPPGGPRPRAGDADENLAAMERGLGAPESRGMGAPRASQPVREPMAKTQDRTICGKSLSCQHRSVLHRGLDDRRGKARGEASAASSTGARSPRRRWSFGRGDSRGNGSARGNRPLVALTLPQDNSSAAH
jgi:hypothetical protein